MYKHTNIQNLLKAIRLLNFNALSLTVGNGDDWVKKNL